MKKSLLSLTVVIAGLFSSLAQAYGINPAHVPGSSIKWQGAEWHGYRLTAYSYTDWDVNLATNPIGVESVYCRIAKLSPNGAYFTIVHSSWHRVLGGDYLIEYGQDPERNCIDFLSKRGY